MRSVICAIAVGLASFWTSTSAAVAQEDDLAKKFSNPIADLISVPFQFNHDGRIDPSDDGWRATLKIQPAIPITLNPECSVISRTILPIPSQWDVAPGAGRLAEIKPYEGILGIRQTGCAISAEPL